MVCSEFRASLGYGMKPSQTNEKQPELSIIQGPKPQGRVTKYQDVRTRV